MRLEIKARLSEQELESVEWLKDRLQWIQVVEQVELRLKITNVTKSWGSTGINPNAGVNFRYDHTHKLYPPYLLGRNSQRPYGEISLNWAGFRKTVSHRLFAAAAAANRVFVPSHNQTVAGESITNEDRKRLLTYFVWAVYYVKTGVNADARRAYEDRESIVARWQDPLWEFVQGRRVNVV